MSKVTLPRGHKHKAKAREAGSRQARSIAGRPLQLSRQAERKARHAVRQRPPLHARLAARVKKETKRLEPAGDLRPGQAIASAFKGFRAAILPHDPRDAEMREQSGERVISIVGAVDLLLFLCVVVLLVIGTIMVYSASMAHAYLQQDSTSYYLFRQTEWMVLGGVGMYVAIRLDYRRWRHFAGIGLVLAVVLMVLLHSHYGTRINGALRWIKIGPFEGQPSDFAKLALVLYAAHWFAGQSDRLRQSLRGLIPFALVVGGVTALVLVEPDLGSTVVIGFALLTVYFVAGARLRHLALLVGAVVLLLGLLIVLHKVPHYMMARLQSGGASEHSLKLRDALGMGGLTGVGLGQSSTKYSMPEVETDSIFAIIGEELGLLGTLSVLLLFIVLAWRGLRASMLAPDAFGRFLATGITCSIVFQGMINMAVVAGAVPFTGVPLPFISYGGSSLSISMVATGILLNISKQAVDTKEGQDSAFTFFRWRHRRSHLPGAGRPATPLSAISDQPRAGGSWRSIFSSRQHTAGARRSPGR